MARRNVILTVWEEFRGERIRSVEVQKSEMQVVIFFPRSGVIFGTADDSKMESIRSTPGVECLLTEVDLRRILKAQRAPDPSLRSLEFQI